MTHLPPSGIAGQTGACRRVAPISRRSDLVGGGARRSSPGSGSAPRRRLPGAALAGARAGVARPGARPRRCRPSEVEDVRCRSEVGFPHVGVDPQAANQSLAYCWKVISVPVDPAGRGSTHCPAAILSSSWRSFLSAVARSIPSRLWPTVMCRRSPTATVTSAQNATLPSLRRSSLSFACRGRAISTSAPQLIRLPARALSAPRGGARPGASAHP